MNHKQVSWLGRSKGEASVIIWVYNSKFEIKPWPFKIFKSRKVYFRKIDFGKSRKFHRNFFGGFKWKPRWSIGDPIGEG